MTQVPFGQKIISGPKGTFLGICLWQIYCWGITIHVHESW